jgi:hypothetical protein
MGTVTSAIPPVITTVGSSVVSLPSLEGRHIIRGDLLVLVGLQFPIADSRKFISAYTGRLNRPAWPSPEPEYEFVRSFGSIQTRGRGGLLGWVGENEICEADRVLRFDRLEPFYTEPYRGLGFVRDRNPVHLRCAFRRFFFDGLAVGKFETGVYPKGGETRSGELLARL